MIKEIVKGVWQFCAYLFVPRWGRSRKAMELRNSGMTEITKR